MLEESGIVLRAIRDLWPGESVLSENGIRRWRECLARGDTVPTVGVVLLGGCVIVRDGNNRIRAIIEHYRSVDRELPEVETVLGTKPLPAHFGRVPYRDFLMGLAGYHGQGAAAFEKMKASSHTTYGADGAEVDRVVLARLLLRAPKGG